MNLRRTAQVLLTATVSAAMLLTATAPVQAEEDLPGEIYSLTAVPAAISIETSYHRLPAADSAAGHGTQLGEGTQAVDFPGVPEGHDAALVRLTGFDAAEDTTVSAAGAPALSVAAGASASTTVLVPLVEGSMELGSDAEIDARVELLASFAGDESAPGATIALTEPVTRAQTAQGLAGESLSVDITEVGVTGQGGVPSTGVRSVWLTATVQTDSAGELSIGPQQASLPQGTTTLTTVVPVQAGSVPFAFTGGEADLHVDVRGWSPEAPQNAQAANVQGGFVPELGGESQDLMISDEAPAELPSASYTDAESVVVLVSAQPGEQPTFLGDDLDAELRGSGIFVDPVMGASAQLAVLDAEEAALISRRGDVDAAVLPLGSFLSAGAEGASGGPELTITSHTDGGTVELGEDAVTVLEGTVASSSAAESVVITVDGEQIGAAELDYSGDTVIWRFTTGAPASDSYAITVEAVDRSGAADSQSLNMELVIPDEDEILIHPDTVIQEEHAVVYELTDDYVILAEAPEAEPGEILVSGSVEGAEEGFLRRVISVDENDEGWVVHTDWATLDEAILQADVESEILWTGVEGLEFEQHSEGPEAGDVEIVDDGDIFVEVVEAPEGLPGPSDSAEPAATSLAPFSHSGAVSSLISPYSQPMPAGFSLNNRHQQCVNMNPKFAMDSDGAKFNMASAETEFRDKRAEILGNGGIAVESDITHCITLTFGLTIELQRTFRVPTGVEVTRFDFVVSSYTAFDNTLGVNYAISDRERLRLFTMHLPPVNFAIGPVPVTLTMEAGIDFTAAWSVEGSAEVNYTAVRSQDVGFRYRNGRFNAVNPTPQWSFPTTVGEDFSATASIEADASVGLNVAMSTKLYGVVGPEVGLGAAIGMDGEVEFNVGEAAIESASFEIYAERTASAGMRFRVPIINRTILEVNDIIRFERRGTLYELSHTREEDDDADEDPSDPPPPEDEPPFEGPAELGNTAVVRHVPLPDDVWSVGSRIHHGENTGRFYIAGAHRTENWQPRADFIYEIAGDGASIVSETPLHGTTGFPSGRWDVDDARHRIVYLPTLGTQDDETHIHINAQKIGALEIEQEGRIELGACSSANNLGLAMRPASGQVVVVGAVEELAHGEDSDCPSTEDSEPTIHVWVLDAASLETLETFELSDVQLDSLNPLYWQEHLYFAPDESALHILDVSNVVTLDLLSGEVFGPFSTQPGRQHEYLISRLVVPGSGHVVFSGMLQGQPEDLYDHNLWRLDPVTGELLEQPQEGDWPAERVECSSYVRCWSAVGADAEGRYYGFNQEGSSETHKSMWISDDGSFGGWELIALRGDDLRGRTPHHTSVGAPGQLAYLYETDDGLSVEIAVVIVDEAEVPDAPPSTGDNDDDCGVTGECEPESEEQQELVTLENCREVCEPVHILGFRGSHW
ncbi:hypothetical protein [Nesterenkonia ebinurensis]|uniref:hypothetical protein n=1 Tax=Nesterenkonia ebinurensis TaxID=2608252 RepID=UPI00123D9DAC|nr:hypothetical protein [Nesterenkonia ebinurensis]